MLALKPLAHDALARKALSYGARVEMDGKVVVDLVDPHGLHLADALPKMKGLAAYAEAHATAYRRIESVALADGKLRVLDLTSGAVRRAILGAKSAASLFTGALATDY